MQGWRLDPLLLFCQLLTAGTALGFGVESLKLRQAVRDIQACVCTLVPGSSPGFPGAV